MDQPTTSSEFSELMRSATTALHASSVTYLMPVVAIAWGVLDGEHVGLPQMGMIAVVLSGVYLVNASKSRA